MYFKFGTIGHLSTSKVFISTQNFSRLNCTLLVIIVAEGCGVVYAILNSNMATSEAETPTDFSTCIRKGRRNACAEIKYCTCKVGDNSADNAGCKADSSRESCPIHNKESDASSSADKNT